jgi:UPF0755 protein
MALHFKNGKVVRRSRKLRFVLFGCLVLLFSVVAAGFLYYQSALEPLDKYNDEPIVVTIEQGMNDAQIGALLKSKGIVRSAEVYELYVRVSRKAGKVQAGSYTLSKSMDVHRIVDKVTAGEINVDLLTILPGKTISELRGVFVEAGYSEDEVDAALDPEQYSGHPALRSKPPLASLEGYLYPESFQRTDSTTLKTIISASLDQMSKVLTKELEARLSKHGLTLHDGVVLASIIEKEVNNASDKPIVSQVFQSRLGMGMLLGSDVTAYYGAESAGLPRSVLADTPYNTRLYAGLPPGPISNFTQDAIEAVAEPSSTDYLYFVAGDDGITYFSRTLQEHEALTAQHCIELCAAP